MVWQRLTAGRYRVVAAGSHDGGLLACGLAARGSLVVALVQMFDNGHARYDPCSCVRHQEASSP